MARLSRSSGAVCFDDEEYDIADVVLLALAEGDWQRLENGLSRGLALEREYGRGVARGRIAEELKRFRYARGLISGKELREWLAARSLPLEDLRRHCRRNLLVEEHGSDGKRVPADGLAEAIDSEAIISGVLGTSAARLADLAAMVAATNTEPDPLGAGVTGLLAEVAAHPSAGLDELGEGELERRAERTLRLLRSQDAFAEGVTTPTAMARCIAEHGVDWLRVECAELTLASEGAARESMLCLRVDGTPLADLAQQLEIVVEVRERYLADVSDGSGPVLASAAIGDPLGPFAGDDGWRVLVVNRRVAPNDEDPELVRRASAAVVAVARERAKAGRVRELAPL